MIDTCSTGDKAPRPCPRAPAGGCWGGGRGAACPAGWWRGEGDELGPGQCGPAVLQVCVRSSNALGVGAQRSLLHVGGGGGLDARARPLFWEAGTWMLPLSTAAYPLPAWRSARRIAHLSLRMPWHCTCARAHTHRHTLVHTQHTHANVHTCTHTHTHTRTHTGTASWPAHRRAQAPPSASSLTKATRMRVGRRWTTARRGTRAWPRCRPSSLR